jgi:hypothetical protein
MSETIINPIEDQQEEQYQGFHITDDHLAEWAIQKIKEAQGDTAKWQAHFAAQLEKIKAANQSTIDFMTGALGSYFTTVPHKETKTQAKYDLPSATLIRKQQQPTYDRDNDALLAYLDGSKRDDLVRVKREPKWDEVKKAYAVQGETMVDPETGEVVAGVKVIARPDVFDVKIKEDNNAS